MVKWLIATDDGRTHELIYEGKVLQPFKLVLNGNIVSPRFHNVGEVKDTIKEFGYNVTEFLQVAGDINWPIQIGDKQ